MFQVSKKELRIAIYLTAILEGSKIIGLSGARGWVRRINDSDIFIYKVISLDSFSNISKSAKEQLSSWEYNMSVAPLYFESQGYI